jgi:hypothetical protein
MTETEWWAATDPALMLRFFQGNVSDRKLRLFGCACWRRVWDLFPGDDDRESLAVAEGFEDGLASEAELWAAIGPRMSSGIMHAGGTRAAEVAAACSGLRADASGDPTHPKGMGDYHAAAAGENAAQCRLLRDIFGNPFRPVTLDPEWLTFTVTALARQMYESRDFSAMPILADALQDAGCDSEDILGHCRGEGPHVRGCWVVDLVLGKE